jgi:hypothetical protein
MFNNKPEGIPKSEADKRLGTVAIAVNNLSIVFDNFEVPAPVIEEQVTYDHSNTLEFTQDQTYQQRIDALAMVQRAFEEQNNEIQ